MAGFVKHYILKNNIEPLPYKNIYKLYDFQIIKELQTFDKGYSLIHYANNNNLKMIKYLHENGACLTDIEMFVDKFYIQGIYKTQQVHSPVVRFFHKNNIDNIPAYTVEIIPPNLFEFKINNKLVCPYFYNDYNEVINYLYDNYTDLNIRENKFETFTIKPL